MRRSIASCKTSLRESNPFAHICTRAFGNLIYNLQPRSRDEDELLLQTSTSQCAMTLNFDNIRQGTTFILRRILRRTPQI
ncbi:hypothetical protein TNCV_2280661 [Trichonephila clavipes]|nr:hypothetical protein TNCV_2280661 [Trichonephila clavipes]